MANFCGKIKAGLTLDCTSTVVKRYDQKLVIINKEDISSFTIEVDNTGVAYKYNVAFELKEGSKGYTIELPANGSGIFGTVEKTTSELGLVQYNQIVNLVAFGVDEQTKGTLANLDLGRYVVALKINNTVEIYGIENGLSTGDYTLDIQSGNGASALTLASGEMFLESKLPLVYKATAPSTPSADFDSEFENEAGS